MPFPLIRYALDPTGINPDNTVSGELHTLNVSPIRAIAPQYGPYFTESVVIYDAITNQQLIKNTDFKCVQLLQEATLKFGKEIAEVILIVNPDVNNQVRIGYQVLGGLYQNTVEGVVTLYEAFLADNRPVDWTNVLNKPFQYPPSLHNHLLKDIYGFEPVIVALERIRNAIVLSDVPAFEAIVDWVKMLTAVVTETEIDNISSVPKYLTFERLLYALDKLNFNGITLEPMTTSVENNAVIPFSLSATNLPLETTLYWTIDHIDTIDADFNTLSGLINVTAGRGQFSISISDSPISEITEHFRVAIRKNGITGPILTRSGIITINKKVIIDYTKMTLVGCIYDPRVKIDPYSYYLIKEY